MRRPILVVLEGQNHKVLLEAREGTSGIPPFPFSTGILVTRLPGTPQTTWSALRLGYMEGEGYMYAVYCQLRSRLPPMLRCITQVDKIGRIQGSWL